MKLDYKKILGLELSKLRKENQYPLQALSYFSKLKEEDIAKMEENPSDYTIDDWNSVLSVMGCRLGIINIENNNIPVCLQHDSPKKKIVMIIGNGFDMDLGLTTSYSSFSNSCFWPFKDAYITLPKTDKPAYSPLIEELIKAKLENWFDFEEVLRQFGMKIREDYGNNYPYAKLDKYALEQFCLGLKKYLTQEMESFFSNPVCIEKSKRTTAKIVINEMIESGATIYSFNYTDTGKLAYYSIEQNPTKEGYWEWDRVNRNINQIHGTVYSNNIVLGVEEDCQIPDNLFFIKKIAQLEFRETSIISHLKEADKVVFFGHSLGNIDACYFKEFFMSLSEPKIQKGKEILFYTYDENSIQQLKDNIQKMNGGRLLQFTNNNYVEFFMTKKL